MATLAMMVAEGANWALKDVWVLGDNTYHQLEDGTIVDAKTGKHVPTTVNGVALYIFTENLFVGTITSPWDTAMLIASALQCAVDMAAIQDAASRLASGAISQEEYDNFVKNTATYKDIAELGQNLTLLIEYHNQLQQEGRSDELKFLYLAMAGSVLSPDPNLAGKLADIVKLGKKAGNLADGVADAAHSVKITTSNLKKFEDAFAEIDPKYVNLLSRESAEHILTGNSTGGGHWDIPELANNGKTKFPTDWDAKKILHEVSDIVTDPNTQWYAQRGAVGSLFTKSGDPAIWVAYEVKDGVRIRVAYEPATQRIVTAFPDNGAIPSYKPLPKAK